MELLGLGKGYDELDIGYRFRTINRTITEPDLVNFVNTTGFGESLFIDVEFARAKAPNGGRLVPGALVFSIAEGLVMNYVIQGVGLAFLSMNFDIKGPCFVGDTIHVEGEVTEIKPTSKDPEKGLVRTRNQIVNQKGEIVIEYSPLRMAASAALRDRYWNK